MNPEFSWIQTSLNIDYKAIQQQGIKMSSAWTEMLNMEPDIVVAPEIVMDDIVVVAFSIEETNILKELYASKGRRSIDKYRQEMREIGAALNKKFGVPLMQGFLQLYVPQKDWHIINIFWNGIGDWQG